MNESQYLLEKFDDENQGQYTQNTKENNELIVLIGLEGNPPPELNTMQQFFSEHLIIIQIFWWTVWVCVLVSMVYKFLLKNKI